MGSYPPDEEEMEMCKDTYINNQTGEELDWEKVNVLKNNAMLKARPELWLEWDFEKNSELGLDIWKMTRGSSSIKPWWVCLKHKYQGWDASSYSRSTLKTGCPYCSPNPRILKGFNDMWTTNPELASLLANPENGYDYTQSSGKYVDWLCSTCNEVVEDKQINKVLKYGLSCPSCSNGWSYPEKFMYHLLQSQGIDFISQEQFKWNKGRKYDFYISNYNTIIETHGRQHIDREGFSSLGGRTLEEEQTNDQFKEHLAKENGIEHYIVIDVRKSELEWIKNSILNSELVELFNLNNVDWDEIELKSRINMYSIIIDKWNEGHSVSDIACILKISRGAIRNALHWGNKYKKCNYSKLEVKRRLPKRNGRRPILQIDKNGIIINRFDGASSAENLTQIHNSSIRMSCKERNLYAGGYIWMYEDRYECFVNKGISIKDFIEQRKTSAKNISDKKIERMSKSIIQLTLDRTYVKEWKSIKEAMDTLNVSNIGEACRGKYKTASGYRWMYKEEYDKYIEEQKQLV